MAKGIRISKLASKMLIIISYLTKHKSKVGNLSSLRFGASRLPYINFVNLFAKHGILRLMIILCLPRYHLCLFFFFFHVTSLFIQAPIEIQGISLESPYIKCFYLVIIYIKCIPRIFLLEHDKVIKGEFH